MPNKNKFLISPAIILKIFIGVNIFMYVVSLLLSGPRIHMNFNPLFALAPSLDALNYLGASGTYPIGEYQAWCTLITANWLHGSLLHLLFNMMALRTLIPLVIKEYGVARMFSIYTFTGIAGFFLSYLGNVQLTIGASSGLCGLIGALLYFGKSRGGQWGALVYKQTTGWVLSLIIMGFLIPNINNWSHAGGLVAGIVFGWLFAYSERRKETIFDKALALFTVLVTGYLLIQPVIHAIILKFE